MLNGDVWIPNKQQESSMPQKLFTVEYDAEVEKIELHLDTAGLAELRRALDEAERTRESATAQAKVLSELMQV